MGSFVEVGMDGYPIVGAAVKWDADSSTPTYIGTHTNPDATEGQSGWVIWKFTYSGTNKTAGEKRTGSWTNRASLGWLI